METEKIQEPKAKEKAKEAVSYKAVTKCYAAGRVYNIGDICTAEVKDNPNFIQVK